MPELESQTRQSLASHISTHPQGGFDPSGHLMHGGSVPSRHLHGGFVPSGHLSQGGFDPLGHLHGGFDPSGHSQPARLTHLPELESQTRQSLGSQISTHPQGGSVPSGHLHG